MATKEYCSNVGSELEVWSKKLHSLSSKIDQLPSIDKYKLLPHIEELHMIMIELDDHLCNMYSACSNIEESAGSVDRVNTGSRSFSSVSRPTSNEFFDYDFGG